MAGTYVGVQYIGNNFRDTCAQGDDNTKVLITIQKETLKSDFNSDTSRRFEKSASVRVANYNLQMTKTTDKWSQSIINLQNATHLTVGAIMFACSAAILN